MGKWIDQLIGAGRGDENPAADAAYRAKDAKKGIDRAKTAKIHQQQHVESEVAKQEGNGPGNGITNGF